MILRPYTPTLRRRQRGFIIDPYRFGAGSGNDPYFALADILCHFESSSGTPRTYVNSSKPANTIVNVAGTVPDISSAQFKFGANSLAYAASGNSRCNAGVGSNIGTGDFTGEFHMRLGSASAVYLLCDLRGIGTDTLGWAIYMNGSAGVIAFYWNGVDRITSGNVISASTWHHVAACRSGTTTRLFVDGNQVGSNYTDTANYTRSIYVLGASFNGSQPAVSSQFDEWRITRAARYTANFTPPIAAYPDA